jgi:hypothetical protein
MKELKRDIEQLDEAGRQLNKFTPTGARLALFLMDNLVELMMYRTASVRLRMDKEWHRPPKYSAEKREKVREYFNEKVNFWAAAGFKDTELGVLMKPEVAYGATTVYAGVQA